MDHGGHVQLHHCFVERIPRAIGQRRPGPITARWVRVEIAAYKTKLLDTAAQLGNAVLGRYPGRLRQLADTHEVARKHLAYAMNQVIALLRPVRVGVGAGQVMTHARSPWRKDGEISAALPLNAQLTCFDAVANLLVRNDGTRRRGGTVFERRYLGGAPGFMLARGGRVVTVTVDDHCGFPDQVQ